MVSKRRVCFLGIVASMSTLITNVLYRNLNDLRNQAKSWSGRIEDPYARFYGKEFEDALERAAKRRKVILIWHPDDDNSRTMESLLPRQCGSCEVTGNKSLISHDETAAVVFLYKYVTKELMPSTRRDLNQFWIWWIREAPPYILNGRLDFLKTADGIGFNLTMNYRKDGDIFSGYEEDENRTQHIGIDDILPQKKHLALAAVSNCHATHGAIERIEYFEKLKEQGLNMTEMGKCFGDESLPKQNKSKMEDLVREYKFFLAFENAYRCKDYVTEKYFRSLKAGTIPVVWGPRKEVYQGLGPPNSFIFAEDFSSIQELVDYLNYLDKNDTAYLEYHRWRKTWNNKGVDDRRATSFCQVCRFLHGINVDDVYKDDFNVTSSKDHLITDTVSPQKRNLTDFYLGRENEDCLNNENLLFDDEKGIVMQPSR